MSETYWKSLAGERQRKLNELETVANTQNYIIGRQATDIARLEKELNEEKGALEDLDACEETAADMEEEVEQLQKKIEARDKHIDTVKKSLDAAMKAYDDLNTRYNAVKGVTGTSQEKTDVRAVSNDVPHDEITSRAISRHEERYHT